MKQYVIPSGKQVKRLFRGFEYRHFQALARLSRVPLTTLWDIAHHPTEPNTGIDTVRKFLKHMEAAARS